MEILLCKMGEMVLKGLNRSRFESKLLAALKAAVAPFGDFSIMEKQSAVYVEPLGECDMAGAFDAASRVFGLVGLSRAAVTEKDMDAIAAAAAKLPLDRVKTFKVDARRSDKRFPLTSPQICAELGERLLDAFPHLTVDVNNPDEVVWVEIREGGAYVHARPAAGAGGLPPGTAGKAALMLSGGIDSPVAGWRMARRGLELLPVHFYSYPYTSPEARDKVIDLARLMARWCGPLCVRVVPFTAVQEAIRRDIPEDLFTIAMRRSMCRIVCRIAKRNGCAALITGESLGQVASQTMDAIAVTQQASELPILRPLIGMDKEEIVRTARHIGTFETSILPHEDCCTVFTPRHPKTRPHLDELLAAEQRVDWETLENNAISGIEKISV